jgi:DNA replication protein DnaC
MHFHQKILKYLLEYREKHNRNFNFLVRQRTDVNDKKFPGGKFAHGLVLQGTDRYCFVALSDKSGGVNATKSVGIVISPTKKNSFNAKLEIVFPGETDQELITFYKDLASKFEDISWDKKGERAWLHIGEFPEDDPTVLYDWLNVYFPIIRATALQTGIERLIPNDDRFRSLQEKLKLKLQEAKKNETTLANINSDSNSIREQYSNWLKDDESSNKIDSYLRAIDILNELLNKDLYLEKNIAKLTILYQDLIENQRDINSKYYYPSAPSYGNNGFYSASVKAFKEFLQSGENMEDDLNKIIGNYKAPLNQIFYGPPGTGKTYNTILEAGKIVTQNKDITYESAQKVFNNNLGKRIEFITFHQNYSYEDFIQGLRPDTELSGELSFFKSDGVFKRIADKALKNLRDSENPKASKKEFNSVFNELIVPLINEEIEELEIKMKQTSFYITEIGEKSIEFRKNKGDSKHTLSINTLHKMYNKGVNDIILGGLQPYYNPILNLLLEKGKSDVKHIERQNYVIIIDEINRANISRVFGELITLIEKDKRSNGTLPLTATLPSGEKFIVPSNLYIIGTMNTADKSIALLDIALRRRFDFKAMYPKYKIPNKTIHNSAFLESLNDLIIKSGKGHDFTIGHSYFMCEEDETFDFENTINNKVIPLLLEYYMNDEIEIKKILDEALKPLSFKVGNWPLEVLKND